MKINTRMVFRVKFSYESIHNIVFSHATRFRRRASPARRNNKKYDVTYRFVSGFCKKNDNSSYLLLYWKININIDGYNINTVINA